MLLVSLTLTYQKTNNANFANMADSSLRRFIQKITPGRTVSYDSKRKDYKAPMWGIPGMTKDEGGPKKPKPYRSGRKPSNGIGVGY